MKIQEDPLVEIDEPRFRVGSYWGADELPGDIIKYKLTEAKEVHPPMLELIFFDTMNEKIGRIRPKDGSPQATTRLQEYKKVLEEKLVGRSWQEVLNYDFKFDQASRLNP